MSDKMFTNKSPQSMLISRLNRVEGAIPYIRRATQVFSDSAVKAPSKIAVNPVNPSGVGTISPSSGIQGVGNAFQFYVLGKFGFTATSTSITIYWDGTNGSQIFVIKRTDGTSHTIPGGVLVIAGLSPSTTYGFLPYNKLSAQDALSFTLGDSGSPMFAISPAASPEFLAKANQNQDLASNESITENLVYYSTTASGSSAGNGKPGVIGPYSNVRYPPGTIQ